MLMSSPQKASWSHIYHQPPSVYYSTKPGDGQTEASPTLTFTSLNSPHLSYWPTRVHCPILFLSHSAKFLFVCQTIPHSLLPSKSPTDVREWEGKLVTPAWPVPLSSCWSSWACWASPALTFELHAVQSRAECDQRALDTGPHSRLSSSAGSLSFTLTMQQRGRREVIIFLLVCHHRMIWYNFVGLDRI